MKITLHENPLPALSADQARGEKDSDGLDGDADRVNGSNGEDGESEMSEPEVQEVRPESDELLPPPELESAPTSRLNPQPNGNPAVSTSANRNVAVSKKRKRTNESKNPQSKSKSGEIGLNANPPTMSADGTVAVSKKRKRKDESKDPRKKLKLDDLPAASSSSTFGLNPQPNPDLAATTCACSNTNGNVAVSKKRKQKDENKSSQSKSKSKSLKELKIALNQDECIDSLADILTLVEKSSGKFLQLKALATGTLSIVGICRRLDGRGKRHWNQFGKKIAVEIVAVIKRLLYLSMGRPLRAVVAENFNILISTLCIIHTEIGAQLVRPKNKSKKIRRQDDRRLLSHLKDILQDSCKQFLRYSKSDMHKPKRPKGGRKEKKQKQHKPDRAVPDLLPVVPPKKLFGRDEYVTGLIETITSKMRDPNSYAARIIIHGSGGIGKSSVAEVLLEHPQIIDAFNSRRYFASCESAISLSRLLTLIVQSFQVRLTGQDLLAQVLSYLGSGELTLLILDNFEICWNSSQKSAFHRALQHFASIKNLTVILTMKDSEFPSGINWEATPSLDVLSPNDANAAFEYYSRRAISEEDVSFLNDLFVDFGYSPLTVSLLAHQVGSGESISDLHLRCLDFEFDTGSKDSPSNLKDNRLFSVIKLAVESLTMTKHPNALRLLRLLCLLPDGLSPYGIEKINLFCRIERFQAREVLCSIGLAHLDKIGSLKSLFPIRSYIQSHYSFKSEDIHLLYDHYLSLASIAEGVIYRFADHPQIYDLVWSELGNMQSVLPAVMKNSSNKDSEIQAYSSAILSLSKFLHWSHLPTADLLRSVLNSWRDHLSPEYRAAYLHMLGVDQYMLNNFSQAGRVLMDALKIYRVLGERLGEATCHWTLGDICRAQGNYAQAIDQIDQAKTIYIEQGNNHGINICLLSLSTVLRIQGELKHAIARVDEALCMDYNGPEHINGIPHEVMRQVIAMDRGCYRQAEIALEKILTKALKLDDVHIIATCQLHLGELCCRQGKFEQGHSYAMDAYRSFTFQGLRQAAADCLRWLGCIECALGKGQESAKYLREAQKYYEQLGDRLHIADLTLAKANLALLQPSFQLAATLGREALKLHSDLGSRRGMAFSHLFLAKLLQGQNMRDKMIAHALNAEELFSYLGNEVEVFACKAIYMQAPSN